jgi:hypothetical protein
MPYSIQGNSRGFSSSSKKLIEENAQESWFTLKRKAGKPKKILSILEMSSHIKDNPIEALKRLVPEKTGVYIKIAKNYMVNLEFLKFAYTKDNSNNWKGIINSSNKCIYRMDEQKACASWYFQ